MRRKNEVEQPTTLVDPKRSSLDLQRGRPMRALNKSRAGSTLACRLLNSHGLRKIPRLVDIRAARERRVKSEQLHWDRVQDR